MDDNWYTHPTDFLSTLTQHDWQVLNRLGHKRFYRKDDMVFHVGSPSDEVFILLEGRVKIFELSMEGKEVILWFCFPGELFGLSELFIGGGRQVNAQACSKVEILALKLNDFERYIRQNPNLAMSVIQVLGYRLRQLSSALLNLASDDVTARVVKLLTRLSSHYGKPCENGIVLDIALTHQEIADMVSASRQTVTTVLSTLRKKSIIKVQQRFIVILDTQWIEGVCGKAPVSWCPPVRAGLMKHTA